MLLRKRLLLATALLAISVSPLNIALAQFGGGAIHVDPGANVYMPTLQRALTAELHFCKKVCEPTPEQFDRIHQSGITAIAALAETYQELQRRREDPASWPHPNTSIAMEFLRVLDGMMPASVVSEYKAEIEARASDNHAANVAIIVQLIDQVVMLDAQQHEKLFAEINNNWDDSWSQGNVAYLYPRYARLPNPDEFSQHLSESQRRLWSVRPKHRDVKLSWQAHLSDPFPGTGLPPFDPPGELDNSAAKESSQ